MAKSDSTERAMEAMRVAVEMEYGVEFNVNVLRRMVLAAYPALVSEAEDLRKALTRATDKLEHAMVMLGSDPEFAAAGVSEFRVVLKGDSDGAE